MPARDAAKFGLPMTDFLYTIEQIASMLQLTEKTLKASILWLEGVNTGHPPKARIVAHNITPQEDKPTWRVSEREFIRYLRYCGFRVYDRATIEYG